MSSDRGNRIRIQGNVFVVTGAGSGIGQEVALLLLTRGARVAAVDVRAEAPGDHRPKGRPCRGPVAPRGGRDLSGPGGGPSGRRPRPTRPGGRAAQRRGVIHRFVPFLDLGPPEIDRVLAVNLGGVMAMSRALLPHLLQRPTAALVNVASMGALVPVPGQTVYGASKAAVKRFSEGLYTELRGTSVAVTAVYPGGVATPITENSGAHRPTLLPHPRLDAAVERLFLTSADRAAGRIVAGAEKGRFRVVIGPDAKLLDLLCRVAPRGAADVTARAMAFLVRPDQGPSSRV